MSTLRTYMRKPATQEGAHWESLYAEALERAQARQDSRLKDLRHYKQAPEQALRRLSILTFSDLEREFPLASS